MKFLVILTLFLSLSSAYAGSCPDLFLASGIDFSFSKEELQTARAQVNREFIDNTYFLIPANDGEAVRSIQILDAVKAPYLHVSNQRWGVTLDKITLNSKFLEKVKRIVIFEIPGVEIEEKLRSQGIEVILIDHHAYNNLDRRKPESSIEQLMHLINWPMSRVDEALAVNDRSYIPGLKKMGLSDSEIREIRKFDLISQGRNAQKIDEKIRLARELIPHLSKKYDKIFIIDTDRTPQVDEGILKQELAIRSETGIVSSLTLSSDSIGFSGDPQIAQRLLNLKFEKLGYAKGSFAQYGGGDPTASMFFGFKPTQPPTGGDGSLVPAYVLEEIYKTLKQPTP